MTDLGPLNYFLGISATLTTAGIFLSQTKYATEILERAQMLNCNPCRTPVDTEKKLGLEGSPVTDPTLYRSIAGALQYLIFTRPDLSYAVQQLCLYMHDPREPHLNAMKRVLRYLRGTTDLGLQLFRKLDVSNPLHLHPNDSAALTIVSVKLKGTKNYHVWSNAMLLDLEGLKCPVTGTNKYDLQPLRHPKCFAPRNVQLSEPPASLLPTPKPSSATYKQTTCCGLNLQSKNPPSSDVQQNLCLKEPLQESSSLPVKMRIARKGRVSKGISGSTDFLMVSGFLMLKTIDLDPLHVYQTLLEKFIGTVRFGNDEYALSLAMKKPNLQYFRVFGSLCYPTNDYDDVGKLKAKADICKCRLCTPPERRTDLNNKRSAARVRKPFMFCASTELTEGLTSVQTSSGLAPQQMTSVTNSTELELTALQSGRSRSALVKDPEPPSVPPTKKQVDDLFQWFDDDDEVIPIPPVVPITPVNVPLPRQPEKAQWFTPYNHIIVRRRSCNAVSNPPLDALITETMDLAFNKFRLILWNAEARRCLVPQGSYKPEPTLENEFQDLHLNLPVLEVLAHTLIYNAILDKYIESLELGKNGSAFVQGEAPTKMKDPGLFTLPCRLGDSKPLDTLADFGSCVNIIPLYLFKKLNIGLLEETDHIFRLADGTKSYPVGIVKDVEVRIGKLKLLNDFYVIDMKKDPETPLLVGRGFLATANVVIDCRMAKIAVEKGITRSVFGVKGINLGEEEASYWTTLGKRESYKP
ncbi:MAK10-like protein [Tanacetum coccineum]|uniref:MAK10-like protein n=1 Tax=Tanacetum coccineum TaxID=301880 RepID=A0ABQ5GSP6_9ASTR